MAKQRVPEGCYFCGHWINDHTRWLDPPPHGELWRQQTAWCPDCIQCCPIQTHSEG